MAIKLISPYGAKADSESSTNDFGLGRKAHGEDGSEWVYAQAGAALTAGDVVGIDKDWSAAKLTKAIADAGKKIAVAQMTFTANYYGWFLVRGGDTFVAKARNACQPNVALYTSATAGYLDDSSTSQTRIYGIVLTDTATSSGAAEQVFLPIEPHA